MLIRFLLCFMQIYSLVMGGSRQGPGQPSRYNFLSPLAAHTNQSPSVKWDWRLRISWVCINAWEAKKDGRTYQQHYACTFEWISITMLSLVLLQQHCTGVQWGISGELYKPLSNGIFRKWGPKFIILPFKEKLCNSCGSSVALLGDIMVSQDQLRE